MSNYQYEYDENDFDDAMRLVRRLSDGEPVRFEERHIDAVHGRMGHIGMNVELEEPEEDFLNPEFFMGLSDHARDMFIAVSSLMERKFHAWITPSEELRKPTASDDRYWGFEYVVGSEERAKELVAYCQWLGFEADWHRVGENEQSRGRGIQNSLATFMLLMCNLDPKIALEDRLMRNIWAGERRGKKAEEKAEIDARFESFGVEPAKDGKWRNVNSVPPGTFIKAVRELLQLPEEAE